MISSETPTAVAKQTDATMLDSEQSPMPTPCVKGAPQGLDVEWDPIKVSLSFNTAIAGPRAGWDSGHGDQGFRKGFMPPAVFQLSTGTCLRMAVSYSELHPIIARARGSMCSGSEELHHELHGTWVG